MGPWGDGGVGGWGLAPWNLLDGWVGCRSPPVGELPPGLSPLSTRAPTKALRLRRAVVGVISDHSIVSALSGLSSLHHWWILGAGRWMLATDIMPDSAVTRRPHTSTVRPGLCSPLSPSYSASRHRWLIDLHAIDRGLSLTSHLSLLATGWVGARQSRCPARPAPPPRRCDTQKHEACVCPTFPRALACPASALAGTQASRMHSLPPTVAGPSPALCPQR